MSPQDLPPWPDGLTDLPTWLAIPLSEYLTEPNPRVRLHWMLDTVEVAIRWAVAVALADVRLAHDGGLPKMLQRSIQEHIERPTVGRWVGMLRSLSKAAPGGALSPAVFTLHDDHIAPLFSSEGSEIDSMLVLRNRVAHGGGISSRKSAELVTAHDARFLDLMRAIGGCTDGLMVHGHHEEEGVVQLHGLSPVLVTAGVPEPLATTADVENPSPPEGAWLTNGDQLLSLSPLIAYGPVRILGKDGQFITRSEGAVPQIYARSGPQSLSYTPLGRDEAHSERGEIEDFRTLFGLNEARAPRAGSHRAFSATDFLKEASREAEGLIGRQAEVKEIKTWLKKTPTRETGTARIAWLCAGPGIGKSMVMSRIARDLSNSSHHGLYYHHFQTGDVRNNRRMFLQLLQEALWTWAPLKERTAPPVMGDVDVLLEDIKERLAVLADLQPKNPRAPAASFRVMLDGLDAIVPQDPDFPGLLRQLAVPGTLFLLSGRPDHNLATIFSGDDVAVLFGPAGLPPMSTDNIRALLLDGLGNARYALLKRDEDGDEDDDSVNNAFVDRVVTSAGGLPLYVELLLEDLRSGFLTVDDEDKLPDGLNTYYEDLIGRMGISDVQINLILLICMLGRAEEPLDLLAIRYLLSTAADINEDDLTPEELDHVTSVLRAGRTLLRETSAPSGELAYSLYHRGFREYINGTPALKRTRRRAEGLLYQMAARWHELPEGNLQNHMFRWGTEYALLWGKRRGQAAVRSRLTDFSYLMARTEALPAFENLDLAREYGDALTALGGPEDDTEFAAWSTFFQTRDHLLRRGNDGWPAHRILLQTATEYADSSPVTQAAEGWLAASSDRWLWLRSQRRPVHVALSACTSIMEGHKRKIDAAELRGSDTLLTWSMDNTLRYWNLKEGTCITAMEGHAKRIKGALILDEERAISWADDATIRRWSLTDGTEQLQLAGHTKQIEAGVRLPNGELLTASRDKTIKRWNVETGECLGTYKGHKRYPKGVGFLPDGRLLTRDRTVRIWDPDKDKPVHILAGHKSDVLGTTNLDDGRLLSWSKDGTLRLWDTTSGDNTATMTHDADVLGCLVLSGDRLLSWSKDGTLRLWSLEDGRALGELTGHDGAVLGAILLSGDRALSWSADRELRSWDLTAAAPLARFVGHSGSIKMVIDLGDGRLLSGDSRGPLEIWDADTGAHLAQLNGHSTTVEGAAVLPDGQALTWASDRTVRIWDTDPALLARIAEIDAANTNTDDHTSYVGGTRLLSDGRAISWAKDKTLRLWGGESVAVFTGHTEGVEGARELSGGRLLSWAADHTFRVWDLATQACLATLSGHTKNIQGTRLMDGDRMLSWSSDFTLRIWDLTAGTEVAVLEGHTRLVKGAMVFSDGRILSWASDATLRLWSAGGAPLVTFTGHTDKKIIEGAARLSGERILSWASDATLRLWGEDGSEVAVLEGHEAKKSVKGAAVLSDGRILSWSNDKTLRLWSGDGAEITALVGHTDEVFFAAELPGGGIISHSKDKSFRLWTAEGAPDGVIAEDVAALEWTPQWMAWKAARRAAWSCGVAVIDETLGGARMLINDEDGPAVVQWHGPRGRWFVDSIDEGAEIIARDTLSLYFLHLYDGSERIDLARAQEIIT
ncbi:MAG: WD40 repeat protein [Myxococcota bacterium]|jgi:WD40 repeat protein